MLKRLLDILLSSFGLIVTAPIVLPAAVAIWLQDFLILFTLPRGWGVTEKIL